MGTHPTSTSVALQPCQGPEAPDWETDQVVQAEARICRISRRCAGSQLEGNGSWRMVPRNRQTRVGAASLWCVFVCLGFECVNSGMIGTQLKEYEFRALRCDSVKTSASYSGTRFCDKGAINREYGVSAKTTGGRYTVLQYNPTRKLTGIRCTKRVSSITAICGAFSHSKLVTPPDVMKPVQVPLTTCMMWSQSHVMTTEDGRQLNIETGSTVTYKYLGAGELSLAEGNVECQGGSVQVMGKTHDNILKLITVTVTMEEVTVFEQKGRLRLEKGMLPRQCTLGFEGCNLDDFTIVIDTQAHNLCPYSRIRVANFQATNLEGMDLLVNDEHKMLMETKERITMPSACTNTAARNLISTGFERIYLVEGDVTEQTELIDEIGRAHV